MASAAQMGKKSKPSLLVSLVVLSEVAVVVDASMTGILVDVKMQQKEGDGARTVELKQKTNDAINNCPRPWSMGSNFIFNPIV